MKTSIITFFTIFASLSFALDLPKEIKLCPRDDPAFITCLRTAVLGSMRFLSGGNKLFGTPSLNPLHIDAVKIGNNDGPVALKQEYHDIKLYGLVDDLKIENYAVDCDKLILHSETWNGRVDFTANYNMDGSILFFPIHGSGFSNISMINLHSTNDIHFEEVVRDGKTYPRVKKYVIRFNPEDVVMRFDNLFDGNKALAEPIAALLNENGKNVFKELQAPYEEAFGRVFKDIANKIFPHIPPGTFCP